MSARIIPFPRVPREPDGDALGCCRGIAIALAVELALFLGLAGAWWILA